MAGLTEEELWKSYGKDAKYDIKKTWEYGVTTRELRYEELPLFKKLTEENQGFGHGHNQVLFNASTKYAIIFNPDVLVTKDVLDRLLDRIKIDKNIAVVSPKVLKEDERLSSK